MDSSKVNITTTATTIPSLEDNHYFMFSKDFNNDSVAEAIRFIIERNLLLENRPSAIKMIINSPGGSLTSAFALIDAMKGSRIPIYTYGLGMIASAALTVFISGAKSHRYITPNTSILSHQYSAGTFGKEHELMATVKQFNYWSDLVRRHYQKCTGLNPKQIEKYLFPPQDVWLSAKEAVQLGLADSVVAFY